jgi:NDP-sugar pyrophosphorylase family protein
MADEIKKGMILAAGLGTRLRPLTYKIPKPLLPLNSHKLIDYSLSLFKKYGIEDVIINLHHLGDMIRDYIGNGAKFGLKVSYSEEPVILGTGGGIKRVEAFFENNPFVCINADSLNHAEIDKVIQRHFETRASATMVLKRSTPGDPYEGVSIDKDGFVRNIGKGEYFYTGLQIISHDLLELLPPAGTVSCLIEDGYRQLLKAQKKIAAFIYDGYFNDLGTPERYERAKNDIKDIHHRFFKEESLRTK